MANKQSQNSQGSDRTDHLKKFQWKQGQSGNPNGRPRRKTLTERILEILEEPVSEGSDETKFDVIARAVVGEMLKNKPWAVQEFWDRLEGRPRQDHSLRNDSGPFTVVVKRYKKNNSKSKTS